MTEEPQSQSSAADEPVTEERPAATGEPPTAQHQTTPSETVKLPTQISEPAPVPPAVETGPQPGPTPVEKIAALVAERPEVGVGGAFAGGIVFALILKRLGR